MVAGRGLDPRLQMNIQKGFGSAFGQAGQFFGGAVEGTGKFVSGLIPNEEEQKKATQGGSRAGQADTRSFEERFSEFRANQRQKEFEEAQRKELEGKSKQEVEQIRAERDVARREALRRGASGEVPFRQPETIKEFKIASKQQQFVSGTATPSSQTTSVLKITSTKDTPSETLKIADTRTLAEKQASEQKIIKKLGIGEKVSVTNEFTRTPEQEKQFRQVELQAQEQKVAQLERPTGLFAASLATGGAAGAIGGGAGAIGSAIGSFGVGGTAIPTQRAIESGLSKETSLQRFQLETGGAAGFRGLQKEISKKDPFSGFVASSLLVAPALNEADRKAFLKEAKASFKRQGFSDAQASSKAQESLDRFLIRGAGAELGGLISFSAGTEITGRALTKQFAGSALRKTGEASISGLTKKQAANLVTGAAFKGIAPAGFIEGAGFEVIQSQARFEQVKPENVLFSGVTGAASAGLLGAGIARTAITRPRLSKAAETFLFGIDPTEPLGDIRAGQLIGSTFDLKIPIKTTTITPTIAPTQTFTKADVKRTKSKGTTFTGIFTPSFTQTKTPSIVSTESNIFTRADVKKVTKGGTTFTGIFTPSKSNTKTNIISPANTQTDILSNIKSNQDALTDALTNTTTTTTTTTNTPVTSFVPVVAPTGFPILPGGLPFGGGRGGNRGKQRSKVINELNAVFGGFAGIAAPRPTRRVKRSSKKKMKRRKRR